MAANEFLLPVLRGPADFRTTHWSVVLAAGSAHSGVAREALERLCRAYWFPLYIYARRRGCSAEDAKDLTQGFFAELFRRNDLQTVDQCQGRFRSFLLASLNHYMANEWDRSCAQKRGGDLAIISLDDSTAEDLYRCEPADSDTPEILFERRWAQIVIERVVERLRAEYVAAEREALFEELKGFLSEKVAGVRSEIASRHSIGVNAVDVAIHRLRRRYGELLREEIAQTVRRPEEVEDEIRYLISVVAQGAWPVSPR